MNDQTWKPPYPYQAEGVEFLRRTPRALLGDEPGLGKSRQAIEAAEGRTLVVAPAMVLDGGTWSDEIDRWADDPGRFVCAPYTGLNARIPVGPVRTAADGHRYQSASKPTADLRSEYAGPWDTLILDEAHMIKNRDAFWTKALLKLSKRVDRVTLMTGTPIPNWAHELYVPLVFLRPGDAKRGSEMLGSYWRWAERWFDTSPEIIYLKEGQTKEVAHVGDMLACTNLCEGRAPTDPCEHYRDFFEQNLGGLFLQRLRDQVLTDLPPLTTQVVVCPMVPAQRRAYQSMRKECLAELADGDFKVAWSSSARHVMLDKLSTGLGVFGHEPGKPVDPAQVACDSGKLDRLAYDLQSRARPTLVVAHYRASVEAAYSVARQLGPSAFVHGGTSKVDRRERVRAFKAGELSCLVGSLDTIAEGLTLTAADMVIFLEHSYKPSRNTQAVRRIHRLGQERPCTMLDYVTPDTVDERKRDLLSAKTDHQIRTLTPGQLRGIV